MLAVAQMLWKGLESGKYKSQTALTRGLKMSKSQFTRMLKLIFLAPDIQEEILFLESVDGKEPPRERALREVVRHRDWEEKRRVWEKVRVRIMVKNRVAR